MAPLILTDHGSITGGRAGAGPRGRRPGPYLEVRCYPLGGPLGSDKRKVTRIEAAVVALWQARPWAPNPAMDGTTPRGPE